MARTLVNKLFNQLTFFAVFLMAHLVRVPFDPDPHHDGLMYTAAIASSTGLFPHRDFFSQYGPLTSFIHGLWFMAAPNTLLSLRLFNGLLLAISSLLLFRILKDQIGVKLAFLISLVWSISSPEILPAGLPWPSVVSSLLLLFVIYISKTSRINFTYWIIFLLGSVAALSLFARMHNLVIPVLVTLFSLLTKRHRFLMYFLLGYFTLLIAATAFLHLHSGLSPFIEQSIIWPLLGHAGSTYGAKALMVNALLLLQFPFFAAVLWLACRLAWKNPLLLLGSLTILLLAAYLYSRRIPEIPVVDRSFAKFDYLSAFVGQQTLQMMTFGLMGVCLALQIKDLKHRFQLSERQILASSISVGALFQLYPSPDAYHVWWIAPLLISGLPTNSNLTFKKFAQPPILLAILLTNLLHVSQVISFDRSRYQSEVLSGMYGTNLGVDEALIEIQRIIPLRSANFECIDGLFAANTRGYLANEVLYVNWTKKLNNPESSPALFLVSCAGNEGNLEKDESTFWANGLVTIKQIG
jgi:hypothetical protein